MARIRTIKPEFFTSEDIVSLTPLSRLFYQSLWCEADREGRLEWKPRTFKLRYFPGDNCDIESMADELIEAGLVVIYRVDGRTYAEIPTFTRHQVINNRESQSKIPPRAIDASSTRESGVQGEGKGKERKGREVTTLSGKPDEAPSATRLQSVEAISYLNEKTGASFKPVESNLRLVKARLNEGALLEEVKAVIDAKVLEWGSDEKMRSYLRPATLFSATNFAQYIGQLGRASGTDDWWTAAGFPSQYEAQNAGCNRHNASQWRSGVRVEVVA